MSPLSSDLCTLSSASPLSSPSMSCGPSQDGKQRDSAICIDEDENDNGSEFCGILEHAIVDDGSSSDSASLVSSSLSTTTDMEADSLTQSNRTTCRRPFSTSPRVLLAAAITADATPTPIVYNHGCDRGYDAFAYETGTWPAAAAHVQSAFPHVFAIFDYGDGETVYLGGGGGSGGAGATPTLRGVPRFWPWDHPPLYACRVHAKPKGGPAVVLYSGLDPSRDSAWADVQFSWRSRLTKTSLTSFSLSLGGITIGIPPLPKSHPRTTASRSLAGRAEETLGMHVGWHRRYRFEVEVVPSNTWRGQGEPTDTPACREAFEWRHCSGAELEALEEGDEMGTDMGTNTDTDSSVSFKDEASKAKPLRARVRLAASFLHGKASDATDKAGQLFKRTLSWRQKTALNALRDEEKKTPLQLSRPTEKSRRRSGWQLVRLVDTPPRDALLSGTVLPAAPLFDRLITEEAGRAASRRRTPDGHEIVAIWANSGKNSSGDNSLFGGTCRFTFLGSGTTGELGERWALMAVASGLAVWEHGRRARQRRKSTVVDACVGLASIGA
ncbi:hypothetical protein SCUCBS95973_009351 [Sporothrix curviconia]|uniref:Uncharacterized protein n=1 Tax=Sporothrix curviconia TaxID=1260050 RepID=A0ABP0CXF8_9PEZI